MSWWHFWHNAILQFEYWHILSYNVHKVNTASHSPNARVQRPYILSTEQKHCETYAVKILAIHITLQTYSKTTCLQTNRKLSSHAVTSLFFFILLLQSGCMYNAQGCHSSAGKKTRSDGPWMSNSLWTLSNMLVMSYTDLSTTCECKLG